MSDRQIVISGVHMDLTEALKGLVTSKVQKLFDHEDRIVRVRVELICGLQKGKREEFTAKGHVEIRGPDLIVSETTEDLYKSIDMMVQKLDRKLRRRSRMDRVRRKRTQAVELEADLPKAEVAMAG